MKRLANIAAAAVTQALSVYYGRHRDVILRHAQRQSRASLRRVELSIKLWLRPRTCRY